MSDNEVRKIGRNIQAVVNGTTLTITINLDAAAVLTSTGKNASIATTGGNVEILDGVKIGLNVYRALNTDEKRRVKEAVQSIKI